jgi:2-C-methyl-D-erythritol 2,4-cyclodiphosphate synthase
MDYRIGLGYDIHRLVDKRKLIIGGIRIPFSKGLKGHSDADVLIHAISDALLGAMGQGDIGERFPDTDPQYRDLDSAKILAYVKFILKKQGFAVSNIDAVLIAQRPKILSFRNRIRRNICSILKISEKKFNLKGKTNEGLGKIGKGKAIACYAIALIAKGVKK